MSSVENISLKDIDLRLRQIIKLLEASATVDPRNRQRVTLDAIKASEASVPTEIAGTVPVSGTVVIGTAVTLGFQTPVAGPPYAALTSPVVQSIAEGPVDQRWRVAEDSHISYQLGIRNKLRWS